MLNLLHNYAAQLTARSHDASDLENDTEYIKLLSFYGSLAEFASLRWLRNKLLTFPLIQLKNVSDSAIIGITNHASGRHCYASK